MLFLTLCWDHPDSAAARERLMPLHKPYIAPHLAQFKVGGFIAPHPGADTTGSMVVIEAESMDAARAVFTGDPYFGAVWAKVDVMAYTPLAGAWIGGETWKR